MRKQNIIKYDYLIEISKLRPSPRVYYEIKRYKHCFSGHMKKDIISANEIIKNVVNNNTAHGYSATFKWAFTHFYGKKFEPTLLLERSGEISKFTTRLEQNEIELLRKKFNFWIDEIKNSKNILENKRNNLINSRLRIYWCFEALLLSGMRIGELASIDFHSKPAIRTIMSKLNNNQEFVEIMINTEKTCKKREILIPKNAYEFFVENERKYRKVRPVLSKSLINQGFKNFADWANLPFKFTAHTLRRTIATFMYDVGVPITNIAIVLGNTPEVVMKHYIISSVSNFDATEIGFASANGLITKKKNLFLQNEFFENNIK